jgi:hypothetical protein
VIEERASSEVDAVGDGDAYCLLWAFSAARQPAKRMFSALGPAIGKACPGGRAGSSCMIVWAYGLQGLDPPQVCCPCS